MIWCRWSVLLLKDCIEIGTIWKASNFYVVPFHKAKRLLEHVYSKSFRYLYLLFKLNNSNIEEVIYLVGTLTRVSEGNSLANYCPITSRINRIHVGLRNIDLRNCICLFLNWCQKAIRLVTDFIGKKMEWIRSQLFFRCLIFHLIVTCNIIKKMGTCN